MLKTCRLLPCLDNGNKKHKSISPRVQKISAAKNVQTLPQVDKFGAKSGATLSLRHSLILNLLPSRFTLPHIPSVSSNYRDLVRSISPQVQQIPAAKTRRLCRAWIMEGDTRYLPGQHHNWKTFRPETGISRYNINQF